MTEQDETTFTAKQLARKLNTDPKTLRKFLRSKESPIEAVGQGGRYEFDADAAKLIAAGFKDWGGVKPTKLKGAEEEVETEEVEAPAKKPRAPRKPKATKGVEVPVIEDAIEELDIEEPSAEELEEIEDLDDLFDELED